MYKSKLVLQGRILKYILFFDDPSGYAYWKAESYTEAEKSACWKPVLIKEPTNYLKKSIRVEKDFTTSYSEFSWEN